MKIITIITILKCVLSTHLSVVSENNQNSAVHFISHDNEVYSLNVLGDQCSLTYNSEPLLNYQNSELTSDIDFNLQNNVQINTFENRIIFADQNQPVLWSFEGFDGTIEGWNDQRVASCGTSKNYFLGGPCNFSKKQIQKAYEDLPAHEQIILTFNFHFLDEWEGETAQLLIEGQIVWQETYNWCEKVMPWMCYKFGINVCGNDIPDLYGQFYKVQVAHDSSSLNIEFVTTLGAKDACQASWGIDNIQIYIN